jgi:hypothetical protein
VVDRGDVAVVYNFGDCDNFVTVVATVVATVVPVVV